MYVYTLIHIIYLQQPLTRTSVTSLHWPNPALFMVGAAQSYRLSLRVGVFSLLEGRTTSNSISVCSSIQHHSEYKTNDPAVSIQLCVLNSWVQTVSSGKATSAA